MVKVDMTLCSHETTIRAEGRQDGIIDVTIESTCEDVRRYAGMIDKLSVEDYSELRGSKIIEAAADACLTPTCLVPSGVYNACWAEAGMISKNLAEKVDPLCIRFQD
ncbi:MAG: DUF6951 family protein [Methanomassiliicoccales archaeon]